MLANIDILDISTHHYHKWHRPHGERLVNVTFLLTSTFTSVNISRSRSRQVRVSVLVVVQLTGFRSLRVIYFHTV